MKGLLLPFMANISETPSYDPGVYQIETNDPVVGGPDGTSNKSAKNLANRTAYLKAQTDDLQANKAPLESPSLSGLPTAPTAATGTNTTQIATTAFVSTALSNSQANATPLMDGVASVGTSARLAKQDHVHPTDTSRQAALGFTPVQQGGGAGQQNNKIYIGWSGTELKAQVDAVDLGALTRMAQGPMVSWGTSLAANLDTAVGNGYYHIEYGGYSNSLLSFNPGGSTNNVQVEFSYQGPARWRNKTDGNTWTSWRTFLTSTDGLTVLPDFLRFTEGGNDTGWNHFADGVVQEINNGAVTSQREPGTRSFFTDTIQQTGWHYNRTRLMLADGSVGVPSLSFESDPETGFYRFADGGFALTSNGAWKLAVYPDSIGTSVPITTPTAGLAENGSKAANLDWVRGVMNDRFAQSGNSHGWQLINAGYCLAWGVLSVGDVPGSDWYGTFYFPRTFSRVDRIFVSLESFNGAAMDSSCAVTGWTNSYCNITVQDWATSQVNNLNVAVLIFGVP